RRSYTARREWHTPSPVPRSWAPRRRGLPLPGPRPPDRPARRGLHPGRSGSHVPYHGLSWSSLDPSIGRTRGVSSRIDSTPGISGVPFAPSRKARLELDEYFLTPSHSTSFACSAELVRRVRRE